MRAWLACSGAELLKRDPVDTVGRLASAQQKRNFAGTPQQEAAWQAQIVALRTAVNEQQGLSWTIALEYELLRLEKRIDAVILTDRAIICLEFKTAAPSPAALMEAEDYALDLRDFHAGSQHHAIVPVLVAGIGGFTPPAQPWLLSTCPTNPLECGHVGLGALIGWVQATIPPADEAINGAAWLTAPYKPVPTIVEAATMLYARNGVADIAAARADTTNLNRTAQAIIRHIAKAQEQQAKTIIFITGVPGAGKTLCGLNAVFGPARMNGAAFLTGNAPLVAVLREALVRDAVARGDCAREEAIRRTKAALQNIHRFLEDCAVDPLQTPPERLIVFDEAQRAWDQAKATMGTLDRPARLSKSEPAHVLEIMSRRSGWSVVVALIGNGQEINTGEAGLREWGAVLAQENSLWSAVAAPRVLNASDPVQRLADAPCPSWLQIDEALDLTVPMRSVRESTGVSWVAAVLAGETAEAQRIAAASAALPYWLTRDLAALKQGLRGYARGERRAGIVRSSGARRLRAEGFGAEITAKEVPDWFLNRWPDVRASDALEAAATEYACQGLELDVAGLAWGGDFLRGGKAGWQARSFSGKAWQQATKNFTFIRNTYRVLLTRARYETIIWVPRGSAPDDPFLDRTRPAAEMDAIAAYLLDCGARPLQVEPGTSAVSTTL